MPDGAGRVYKVVLFGETGSGKSSIINLLADGPVADVAIGAEACTRRSEWHQISLRGKIFRLWDTVGFSTEAANPLLPYEQTHSVLRNLGDGVDLILLCACHNGFNASLRSLYWLLDSFFFRGRAKIALVVTKLDELDDGWWDRNKDNIAHSCSIPVRSLPHACVTTISAGDSNSNRDQSKLALEVLLGNHATFPTPLLDHHHLSTDAAYETAVKSLKTHCSLSHVEATTLVKKFKSPTRPFHAVLLGEHGAGKSSIINLIAGSPVAKISGEFYTCTLNCRSYEVNTGSHQFMVWDTIGLNGPFKHKPPESAIGSVARLVCDLRRRGNIDLLVFCKEFNWTPPWELQIFRLFKEIICESKIPIAFIITHLENLDPMEEWWEKNGDALLASLEVEKGAVAGHACITSALDEKTSQDKLLLSRRLVHTMLETSVSQSSGVSYKQGVRGKSPPVWEKVTVENLAEYSGLSNEVAEELCEMFHPPERWFDERSGPDSINCISLPILF